MITMESCFDLQDNGREGKKVHFLTRVTHLAELSVFLNYLIIIIAKVNNLFRTHKELSKPSVKANISLKLIDIFCPFKE